MHKNRVQFSNRSLKKEYDHSRYQIYSRLNVGINFFCKFLKLWIIKNENIILISKSIIKLVDLILFKWSFWIRTYTHWLVFSCIMDKALQVNVPAVQADVLLVFVLYFVFDKSDYLKTGLVISFRGVCSLSRSIDPVVKIQVFQCWI